MKIYIHDTLDDSEETEEEIDLFCMSNIRGKDICVPHKMPFSFFFSERESSHAICVKPVFNPNRISKSSFGTLELHGDWKYTPGPGDEHVPAKQIREMKQFFRKYKVLFAAVWESELPDSVVQNYFQGYIPFSKLLREFYFYEDYKEEMRDIRTIEELEDFVRDNHVFNMWD